MSSILYIGNDYCYTLEQLQDYFRHISSDQDVLYNELLTLQRDGLIVQWLEEGTETETALAKRIKGLTKNLTNKEVMENLAEILTNKNKNFNTKLPKENLTNYFAMGSKLYNMDKYDKDSKIFSEISSLSNFKIGNGLKVDIVYQEKVIQYIVEDPNSEFYDPNVIKAKNNWQSAIDNH
jgi:hypothetical protein